MRKITLFIPMMAAIVIWNLASCTGTNNTSGYSVDSSLVEQTSAFDEAMPEDFLGGRTPWEEFYIDSQEYGYANVRQTPSKDSPVVKEIQTGEHFYGWRMEDDLDWIEVYDNDGSTMGYMFYACARHTGNKSDEGADYAAADYEEDYEEDYEDNYGDDSPSDSYATPSRNTWTGASSVEELRQKLDGTYWHTDPSATKKDRLFIYELHFSNGKISMKTYMNAKANERPTDKKWVGGDDEFVYPSYKINYHSRGDFISVDFGQEEDLKLAYRSFSICFMENCRIATLFQFGEPDGLLKFGRFNPNK